MHRQATAPPAPHPSSDPLTGDDPSHELHHTCQQRLLGLQAVNQQPSATKTAVSRPKVAELRTALLAAGLPTDGLKPQLIERLLSFRRQPEHDKGDAAQPSPGSGDRLVILHDDVDAQAAHVHPGTAVAGASSASSTTLPELQDVQSSPDGPLDGTASARAAGEC